MVLLNSEVDCKNGQKGIYSLAVIIVTALLQTGFFFHLDTLYSTFSRVNGTSAPSVSAIEVQDVKKGKLKVKNTIYGSLGFADLFVRLKIYSKFAAKTFLEWNYLF